MVNVGIGNAELQMLATQTIFSSCLKDHIGVNGVYYYVSHYIYTYKPVVHIKDIGQ